MKKVYFFIIIFLAIFAIVFISFPKKEKKANETSEEKELFLLNWEDYLSQGIIEDFEKKYGISVHIDTIQSSDEILPILQSSPQKYDLILIEDSVVPLFKDLNFLGEINKKSIPNLIYLKDELRINPYDPFNKFCIPYNKGFTGIVINEKYVKDFDGTRKILFDKNYKGKISLPNMPEEILINALFYLDYPINSPSQEQLEKALELVKQQKNLGVFYQDPIEQRESLLKEEVWLAYIFSTEFLPIKDLNPNLKFFPLKEGVLLWADNWCLLSNAPHKTASHLFLNFILDPENNAKNAQDIGILPVVNGAEKFLKKEYKETLESSFFIPEDILKKSQYFFSKNRPEISNILYLISQEIKI
jgi:spermidine/putrescine transport system substrate-binding protein